MVECSLHSDSSTKAENVYATYLVEHQAKEKQAALNKTEKETPDVFLVERKAEAKQNSAKKIPLHEHLEAYQLLASKNRLMGK